MQEDYSMHTLLIIGLGLLTGTLLAAGMQGKDPALVTAVHRWLTLPQSTLEVFVAGAIGIGLCWWRGYFILAGGCGVVLLLLGVLRLLGS